MVKIIGGVLLGFLVSSGGVYLAYYYVKGIDTGASPLLLLGSFILIGSGVYFLIRVSKSQESIVKKPDMSDLPKSNSSMAERLEKNNELLRDWNKTGQMRDKLKMMQIAAADEDAQKSE